MLDATAAEPKRVLLLHSFGRDFSPFSDFAARFREELFKQSPDPIDLYESSLMSARFREPIEEAPFAEYLRTLFAERKVDLIVAFAAPAAQFIQRYRSQLFPTTPMLVTAVEQRRFLDAALTANDTVVALKVENSGYFDSIRRLLPGTTTIAVVIGDSPLERYWVGEMRREFQPFADRLHFEWLNTLSFDAILKRVAALPPHSAIFYPLLAIDAAGVPHEQEHALASVYAAANAPMFSIIDNNFGRGVVGGPMISTQELGRRGAEVAVRILGGAPPASIETPPLGPGTPLYDGRELRRWNISEALLPPGSIVQFREPSVWQEYRWQIAAAAATWLMLVAIVALLLVERHRRRKAELQSRSRLMEVMHLNRTAAAGALSASISHELNQSLGAIMSNAEAGELLLSATHPDLGQVKEILADIRHADQHAADVIQNLRKLLRRQSVIEAQEFDLNDVVTGSLPILLPEAQNRGIALRTDCSHRPLPVLADRTHLQQVILNLAMNGMDAMIGSTSRARTVTIQTALNDGHEVQVAVADSGTGISAEIMKNMFETFYTTKPEGTGLGLSIARTIVEIYGGKIWAENRAEGGAIFRFTMPLATAQVI